MKYLNTYRTFENYDSKDLIDNVNDILLELNDQGFNCIAKDGPMSQQLEASVIIKNIPKGYKLVKTHDIINVFFSRPLAALGMEMRGKPGFEFDDIMETYYRIKTYLTDNGYIEDVNFEGHDLESAFKKRKEDNKKIMGAGKTTHTGVTFMKPL